MRDLISVGQVPIDTLARRCGVSRMMVHSDLDILAAGPQEGLGRAGELACSRALSVSGCISGRRGTATYTDADVLKLVSEIMASGSLEVLFGDDTSKLSDPKRLMHAIRRIVHEGGRSRRSRASRRSSKAGMQATLGRQISPRTCEWEEWICAGRVQPRWRKQRCLWHSPQRSR